MEVEKLQFIATNKNPVHQAHTVYTIAPIKGGGVTIQFHEGDPSKVGWTGLTNEVLIEILIDRLKGYQNGPFACIENDVAITALESSLLAARLRLMRKIEDKSKDLLVMENN